MTPLRVAIVGAGGISQRHFEGYGLAGCDVVAFADPSETVRAVREQEWKARGYADAIELLDTEKPDAISICTPNAYHAPVAIAAMQRGIHVLCEKPLSLDLNACQQMIDAAKQYGVVLQTGHHLRSSPLVATAKALMDEGRIGEVTFMRLRQAHDWGGAAQVRGVFGSREASGGGTLLDNGCHMMDLARHFGGDVSSLYAQMRTLKFEIEVEDTSLVSLNFASGALGSVENAWTAVGWEESFYVYGTKGALECTNRLGKARLRFVHREFGGTTWEDVNDAWYEFAGTDTGHRRGVQNFVRSITEGLPIICTGEDGRESVRLVLAAYESAAAGQPVQLSGDR